MKDKSKTKEQLIKEITKIRQRFAELDESEAKLNKILIEIQKSEYHYRLIFDSVGDAIHIIDRELRIIIANKAFTEWIRVMSIKADIVGLNVFEAFPFLRETVKGEYEQVFKTGKTLITEECNILYGRNIYTESRKIPIMEENRVVQIITVIRDITDHKKAEEDLRENERQYRLLTEKMSDIVWIADMNLQITYISPSVKNILGFSQEERMRQRLDEQLTPHSLSLVLEAFSRELALEEQGNADPDRTLKIELEHYRKDGSTCWMELVITGLRNDQGVLTRFHGVSRDINERKMAEEKLQQTLESLRKAVGTTIQVLVSAVESRDTYTSGHQSRSADLACAIATEMGLAQEKIEGILMAGIIHDIGKLSIPAEILSKPTKLTDIEFALIKEHPEADTKC